MKKKGRGHNYQPRPALVLAEDILQEAAKSRVGVISRTHHASDKQIVKQKSNIKFSK